MWLKENGIDSYDELAEKAKAASSSFGMRSARIKEIEARQKEINELQKAIGTYGKTKEIYAKYRTSGWDRGFYEIHRTDIVLYRAAKKRFNEKGYGKDKRFPTIKSLREEWAKLEVEKKKLYRDYREERRQHRNLQIAKDNCERLLGIKQNVPIQTARERRNRGTR